MNFSIYLNHLLVYFMETFYFKPDVSKVSDWAISCHEKTNHYYDKYLPYSFHLRMVEKNVQDFISDIPEEDRATVLSAAWCHDLIEDARVSYMDILSISSKEIAEISRAVTNYGRGRTREERMPDSVYHDIANTKYATFVKLADRLANVQYGKMTGSSMLKKYKKEHVHFKKMIYVTGQYEKMWSAIEQIFNES